MPSFFSDGIRSENFYGKKSVLFKNVNVIFIRQQFCLRGNECPVIGLPNPNAIMSVSIRSQFSSFLECSRKK